MTYTTAAQDAATIRSELKKQHGWTARQVSVRADTFSMGSSIDVTIKDPAVPLAAVKAIAERAEHIRRCEVSGEILGGGNRYVSVRYSREAVAALGQPYVSAVQAAVDAVEPGSGRLQPVDGTPYLMGRPDAWRLTVWGESFICQTSTVEDAAQTIGARMVG